MRGREDHSTHKTLSPEPKAQISKPLGMQENAGGKKERGEGEGEGEGKWLAEGLGGQRRNKFFDMEDKA